VAMLTMLASYAAYDTSYAGYAGCLCSICWLSSHRSYAGWLPILFMEAEWL